MMSARTIVQHNGSLLTSRSQLATNSFLPLLGQVFGYEAFTSRDVSNRFGLDFLNICKVLSRMAHRPYYLLSARKMPRPYGGYENSYMISARGWKRIGYLQKQPAPLRRGPIGDPMEQAQYLAHGKGDTADLMEHIIYKTLTKVSPPVTSNLDEKAMLLFSIDPRILPFELVKTDPIWHEQSTITIKRASYLQQIGLIPEDINIPLFVLNAYGRDSSESAILLALALRGGINLKRKLSDMKVSSLVEQDTQTVQNVSKNAQQSSPAPPRIGCDQCFRYERLLKFEILYLKFETLYLNSVIDEKGSLRSKLDLAFQVIEQHKTENRKLKRHIARITRCLGLVTTEVNEFNLPIVALPVKWFINTALGGLALLNDTAS